MTKTNKQFDSVSYAIFEDIEQVAETERARIMGEPGEPVEIQLMRMEAAQEARRMTQEAMEIAEHLKETAREEGRLAGFEEGHQRGYAAGMADAEEERLQYRRDIEQFIGFIEAERQRLWRESEPQILAFVLELAQKVVKDDARINRDVVQSIIRNALRRVVDTNNIRIRVNGDDLETVRSSREDLIAMVDGIRHLEIVEDRRVSPGGCVMESGSGTIDSRIETQFDEIEKALKQDTVA